MANPLFPEFHPRTKIRPFPSPRRAGFSPMVRALPFFFVLGTWVTPPFPHQGQSGCPSKTRVLLFFFFAAIIRCPHLVKPDDAFNDFFRLLGGPSFSSFFLFELAQGSPPGVGRSSPSSDPFFLADRKDVFLFGTFHASVEAVVVFPLTRNSFLCLPATPRFSPPPSGPVSPPSPFSPTFNLHQLTLGLFPAFPKTKPPLSPFP